MSNINHQKIIQKFYFALSNRDIETMLSFYHKNIIYEDVGFGRQKGKNAKAVWYYLMKKGDKNVIISFRNIQIDRNKGQVQWTAKYKLGHRYIENNITATFRFKDGKIIYHKDDYSLWKWSQQAFGCIGYLVGWLPLFRWLIRWQMKRSLRQFQTLVM